MGPCKIMKQIGKVAYKLDLPIELAMVHGVFHVLMLRKFMGDPNSIVLLKDVIHEKILTYEEISVENLDLQVKILRNKEVASIKVL